MYININIYKYIYISILWSPPNLNRFFSLDPLDKNISCLVVTVITLPTRDQAPGQEPFRGREGVRELLSDAMSLPKVRRRNEQSHQQWYGTIWTVQKDGKSGSVELFAYVHVWFFY